MADNSIQSATDGNFEAEVLTASNSQPVMVDFWAEWCRPCHMLAPTVAEIAHDYAGKLKVMKLNVDEAMNSAGKYRVPGNTHVAAVQERASRRADCGSGAEGTDHQGAGTAHRVNWRAFVGRRDWIGAPRLFWHRSFRLPPRGKLLT